MSTPRRRAPVHIQQQEPEPHQRPTAPQPDAWTRPHDQPMAPTHPPEPLPLEPLLVRVEEAARILSLSRSTIYEMMDAGELPSVRRGTARRIPVAALRAWVARQTGG
ncbi:helix-turn-helix domain-containing protein [Candidatus Chloroploca asiatica]|nr:helix-turn-helix domain-containing protein [Candidatus Chloroploca asiatica]